ncbi:MAG: ABC-2 transporter permease [Peptococcia bacterium]|jgi:ABC-2 type transport system permease protein
MYSLILKDLLIQKKTLGFILGYSMFLLFVFQSPDLAEMVYVIGAMASTYILILGACAYEGKGGSEIVLNSFPLRRKDVVRARYLSVFVFMFLSLVIIGFSGAVMKGIGLPFPQRYLSWFDVMGVAVSSLLLTSLYLPFYFKFGYIRARLVNLLVFFLFFFIPAYVMNYYQENSTKEWFSQTMIFLDNHPAWLIGGMIVMLLLIMMYLSSLLSVKFYQWREF